MATRMMLFAGIVLLSAAYAMPTPPLNGTINTTKRVLVVGDSWGTVVGAGSAGGLSFFERKLKQHGCGVKSASVAVPGTMAQDWDNGNYLKTLKLGAKTHDYVWVVLMGNDAMDFMPGCAEAEKKTADQCGDELYEMMMKHMGNIADAVHEANPNARVVGFGYDTMFGGLGCGLVTRSMIPQCYRVGGGGNRCFNTQFLRIQQVWNDLAANKSWVDATSILGATQSAAGDPKAVLGKSIDMDKMGPAKYWPDYEGCFHPGVVGGEDSGAMVVMEAFYKQYWSKELSC